ncbi:hypothetical protein D5S18_18740 [Nocardia panacis]|uniref:Uncharacterized protein n=1 Tax=Nocardia panacis TaxID=2340916 RepID=A0A3A4KEX8_9NOCA|nr:hypothetical protein D5S18_18740 [Nocardia panacis]
MLRLRDGGNVVAACALEILVMLGRLPGARTVGDISHITGYSIAATAAALDWLERRGSVRRVGAWAITAATRSELSTRPETFSYLQRVAVTALYRCGARTGDEIAWRAGESATDVHRVLAWLYRHRRLYHVTAYQLASKKEPASWDQ